MRMMVMVMPSLYGSIWLIMGSNVFNKWPLSAYPVQVPPSPWGHKGTLSSGSWPLPPHLNVGIRRLDGVSCPLDTPSFVMKSKDEMFPRTFPCIGRARGSLERNHHQLLWEWNPPPPLGPRVSACPPSLSLWTANLSPSHAAVPRAQH